MVMSRNSASPADVVISVFDLETGENIFIAGLSLLGRRADLIRQNAVINKFSGATRADNDRKHQ
jgi:hypothetical protein